MYFMYDCLMHKKILKFTLECTLYLYFGECYIFLTKYEGKSLNYRNFIITFYKSAYRNCLCLIF